MPRTSISAHVRVSMTRMCVGLFTVAAALAQGGPFGLTPAASLDADAAYASQGPAGGLDRHGLRARLTSATPTPGVETLVVAFEGTGAFEPRVAPLVMQLLRAAGGRVADGDALVDAARAAIARAEGGRDLKWSALMAGPLPALLEDPALTGGFDWASFPSEEAEVLAGMDSVSVDSIRRLRRDVAASRAGLPRGVVDAHAFVRAYLAAWPEGAPRPRLVVITHSSGGRAAVKCLEEWKKDGIEVDLVFSIDPVRAAHEALSELLPQMIGQGSNYNARRVPGGDWVLDRLGVGKPVLPRVWHRHHPAYLYKPGNARRWVSVYQRADTLGMKIYPRHGIQGSALKDADHEEEIGGLGDDGHGAIGYAPRTLELWRAELAALPRAGSPRPGGER